MHTTEDQLDNLSITFEKDIIILRNRVSNLISKLRIAFKELLKTLFTTLGFNFQQFEKLSPCPEIEIHIEHPTTKYSNDLDYETTLAQLFINQYNKEKNLPRKQLIKNMYPQLIEYLTNLNETLKIFDKSYDYNIALEGCVDFIKKVYNFFQHNNCKEIETHLLKLFTDFEREKTTLIYLMLEEKINTKRFQFNQDQENHLHLDTPNATNNELIKKIVNPEITQYYPNQYFK